LLNLNEKQYHSLILIISRLEDGYSSIRKLISDVIRAKWLDLLDEPLKSQVQRGNIIRLNTAILGQ
jgi:hypothetical protein